LGSPEHAPSGQSARLDTAASGEGDEQLLSHLRLLVDEQAPLWGVLSESTIVESASVVRSGRWNPQRCSRVLRLWLEAGLIGVCRATVESDESHDLDAQEAYLALERFELWRDQPALHLFATEAGASESDETWVGTGFGN
jgi:hypothetical protein